MSSRKVSIALDANNFLWLKSQTITSGKQSLSDTVNMILTRLRTGSAEERGEEPEATSNFEATAKISECDPDLEEADAAVRKLFARSLEATADRLGN